MSACIESLRYLTHGISRRARHERAQAHEVVSRCRECKIQSTSGSPRWWSLHSKWTVESVGTRRGLRTGWATSSESVRWRR